MYRGELLVYGKGIWKNCGKNTSSTIRRMNGDHGSLHTYGMHRHNGAFQPFADTHALKEEDKIVYKQFVEAIYEIAEKYFPMELSVMVQSEYSRGVTSSMAHQPCNNLTLGIEGPCSISTSVNFATPQ